MPYFPKFPGYRFSNWVSHQRAKPGYGSRTGVKAHVYPLARTMGSQLSLPGGAGEPASDQAVLSPLLSLCQLVAGPLCEATGAGQEEATGSVGQEDGDTE